MLIIKIEYTQNKMVVTHPSGYIVIYTKQDIANVLENINDEITLLLAEQGILSEIKQNIIDNS